MIDDHFEPVAVRRRVVELDAHDEAAMLIAENGTPGDEVRPAAAAV
jgi:hypothetical protein